MFKKQEIKLFVNHRFRESTEKPERFFNTLPPDWQAGIVPYWSEYKHTARIFVLESATEVLGGGIVFSTLSPDTQPAYAAEAQQWFDEGYLYIGFLWIGEQHRDQQLGSAWLQSVYHVLPKQKFWLSIEEHRLASFYIRNGFELKHSLQLADSQEWILVMNQQQRDSVTVDRREKVTA